MKTSIFKTGLGFIAGIGVMLLVAWTNEPQQARAVFDLNCERYETADQYLTCELVKANQDMAKQLKRIAKIAEKY